jgi:DnaJ-class molecular chaperone
MATTTCGACNGVGSKRGPKGATSVCAGCNGRGYMHGDDESGGMPEGTVRSDGTQVPPGQRPERKNRPLKKKDRF